MVTSLSVASVDSYPQVYAGNGKVLHRKKFLPAVGVYACSVGASAIFGHRSTWVAFHCHSVATA